MHRQKKNYKYPRRGHRIGTQVIVFGDAGQTIGKRPTNDRRRLRRCLQLNLDIYFMTVASAMKRSPTDQLGVDTGVVFMPAGRLTSDAGLLSNRM